MMFSVSFLLSLLIFLTVFGVILVVCIRGIAQWSRNNHAPRLTVEATVVAKRTDVSLHRHPAAGDTSGAHGFHTTTASTCYATFQVESGDRMELHVSGFEYGQLAEGDRGQLSFQGTRYLGFVRQN